MLQTSFTSESLGGRILMSSTFGICCMDFPPEDSDVYSPRSDINGRPKTTLYKSILESQWIHWLNYSVWVNSKADKLPKSLSSSEMMSPCSCIDGVHPSFSLLHPILITSQDHMIKFSLARFTYDWKGSIGKRNWNLRWGHKDAPISWFYQGMLIGPILRVSCT